MIERPASFGSAPIGIALATFLLLPPAVADAGEETAIEWREALVTVEAELREVEGHAGHAVGLAQQRGFAFYDDGEVATVRAWLTFVRSAGQTAYQGYAIYTFPDQTTKIGRFTGSGDPDGPQEGTFTIEGGTGRYTEVTGEGSFAGHAFPPHGDIFLDVSGTYSQR